MTVLYVNMGCPVSKGGMQSNSVLTKNLLKYSKNIMYLPSGQKVPKSEFQSKFLMLRTFFLKMNGFY